MSQKFGKYRLHDALNEGGMTEIWLATDEHEQVVALRRLRPRPKSSASKLFMCSPKTCAAWPNAAMASAQRFGVFFLE